MYTPNQKNVTPSAWRPNRYSCNIFPRKNQTNEDKFLEISKISCDPNDTNSSCSDLVEFWSYLQGANSFMKKTQTTNFVENQYKLSAKFGSSTCKKVLDQKYKDYFGKHSVLKSAILAKEIGPQLEKNSQKPFNHSKQSHSNNAAPQILKKPSEAKSKYNELKQNILFFQYSCPAGCSFNPNYNQSNANYLEFHSIFQTNRGNELETGNRSALQTQLRQNQVDDAPTISLEKNKKISQTVELGIGLS